MEVVVLLLSYCSFVIMQEYDSIEGVPLGSVRKGGRVLVEIVVLLMPHGSREHIILQDYDSIEALYFKRNTRVQWSEWHEWWYNRRGERMDPDRWRLWRMWEQNHCSAYAAQLRNMPWA